MQKVLKLVKGPLKYSTILIAIILFISQIYYGFIKSEEDFKKITNKNNLPVTQDVEDQCERSNGNGDTFIKVFEIISKCLFAFLAGGLISDMKFIKFGVV
jgi:hypothetical protein